jgi:hypothetical protein
MTLSERFGSVLPMANLPSPEPKIIEAIESALAA